MIHTVGFEYWYREETYQGTVSDKTELSYTRHWKDFSAQKKREPHIKSVSLITVKPLEYAYVSDQPLRKYGATS